METINRFTTAEPLSAYEKMKLAWHEQKAAFCWNPDACEEKINWKSFASNCMWMFAFHARFFSDARTHTQNNCNNNKWCLTIELFNSSHAQLHTHTHIPWAYMKTFYLSSSIFSDGTVCNCYVVHLVRIRSTGQFYNSLFHIFLHCSTCIHPQNGRNHKKTFSEWRCSKRKSPQKTPAKNGLWINLYLQHLDLLNLLHLVRRVFTISVYSIVTNFLWLAAFSDSFNPNCTTIKSTFVGKLYGTHDWMRSTDRSFLFPFRMLVCSIRWKSLFWHGFFYNVGSFSFSKRQELYGDFCYASFSYSVVVEQTLHTYNQMAWFLEIVYLQWHFILWSVSLFDRIDAYSYRLQAPQRHIFRQKE